MCLPDAHFPNVDRKALECALRCVEYLKPHLVIVLGDWLDADGFSSHAKSKVRTMVARSYLEAEIVPCRATLDRLQQNGRQLVYLEGNHEYRVERWAIKHAGSAAADIFAALDPKSLLSLRSNGRQRKNFTWVPYKDHYAIAPDLWAVHGWSTSKNAAADHLARGRNLSIVHGHTHRMGSATERLPSGQTVTAMSPGCLAELAPDWLPAPTTWVHGLTLIYQSARDPFDWTPYNVLIKDGRAVLPHGEAISA